MTKRYTIIDEMKIEFSRTYCCPFFERFGGRAFCSYPKCDGCECEELIFPEWCPLRKEE